VENTHSQKKTYKKKENKKRETKCITTTLGLSPSFLLCLSLPGALEDQYGDLEANNPTKMSSLTLLMVT
jgi:hypothetical protein